MAEDTVLAEAQLVVYRRYKEAREYGLTRVEARLFAESERDVGELRKLREWGCPPDVAARILL